MFAAPRHRLNTSRCTTANFSLAVVLIACQAVFAVNNPVPYIDSPTVPGSAIPGGAGFTIAVNGAGFVNGSVVAWNGTPLSTTFVSPAQVTAAVPGSVLANASTASITVANPAPGGGVSNVIYFEIATPTATLDFSWLLTNGSGLTLTVAADFNGDGKLDLAGAWYLNSVLVPYGVAVRLGNGDGSFQAAVPTQLADQVSLVAMAVGDFNGDGMLDIVVTGENVAVLLGNGDGTFQAPINIPKIGINGSWMAAGDFNGDGNLDLVTSTFGDVTVVLGNGDGTFQTPTHYTSGLSALYGAIGDFNGDGILDIAVQNERGQQPNDGDISILLGNGDGTFQPPTTYPGEAFPQALLASDVNGDGKLDLIAVTDNGLDGIAVLLGNGDGSFQAPVIYQGYSVHDGGAMGDINADGSQDVIIPWGDNPAILPGNGDGTFQSQTYYPRPVGPSTFEPIGLTVVGDFNNDGRLDLANLSSTVLQGHFPMLSVDMAALSFPSQTVGTISALQTITLENFGGSTVTLSGISLVGAGADQFKQVNTCPNALAVGVWCQITVTFAPTLAGAFTASLSFPHNGLGSESIRLAGTGDGAAPELEISPGTLNFPPQPIGVLSSAPVTLTSPGPGTVAAPTVTISGKDGDNFSFANMCTSELLPMQKCEISVSFTPTTVGISSSTATMTLVDNAFNSPQSVPLIGSGPDFLATAPSPVPATVAAGETATYEFELLPEGGFNQTVMLTCEGAPAGAKCSVPPSVTLDGKSSLTVHPTVTTTARSSATEREVLPRRAWFLASGLLVMPLIVSLCEGRGSRKRTHWILFGILFLLLLIPACGGSAGSNGNSGPGTSAGTYHLTVVGQYATNGATLMHTVTLTLVVD